MAFPWNVYEIAHFFVLSLFSPGYIALHSFLFLRFATTNLSSRPGFFSILEYYNGVHFLDCNILLKWTNLLIEAFSCFQETGDRVCFHPLEYPDQSVSGCQRCHEFLCCVSWFFWSASEILWKHHSVATSSLLPLPFSVHICPFAAQFITQYEMSSLYGLTSEHLFPLHSSLLEYVFCATPNLEADFPFENHITC